MMGQQLTATCQTHGVDGIWLEYLDCAIGDCRYDEQRQEQFIATCHLSSQEDTHKRGVHNTRHHTRHSHQSEVFHRQIHAEAEMVYQVCKEKTCHTSHIERRGECSSHTSSTIGGRCGKRLEQDNHPDVDDYEGNTVAVAVEY